MSLAEWDFIDETHSLFLLMCKHIRLTSKCYLLQRFRALDSHLPILHLNPIYVKIVYICLVLSTFFKSFQPRKKPQRGGKYVPWIQELGEMTGFLNVLHKLESLWAPWRSAIAVVPLGPILAIPLVLLCLRNGYYWRQRIYDR